MATDNTYTGAKGQDNDGAGIMLAAGVEQNSYANDTYSVIDKEIKGGLHYIKYKEDLTDDTYAGILPSRARIGMMAFVHQEYNNGSPVDHLKYYTLKQLPSTNLANWEELTTGSNLELNKVGVVSTFANLPIAANTTEGDIYNVTDGRQESIIYQIRSVNDNGVQRTYIHVTEDVNTSTAITNSPSFRFNGSSIIGFNDLSIKNSIFIDFAVDPANVPNELTEFKVGDFSIYNPQVGEVYGQFELTDNLGAAVDSSTWGAYTQATNLGYVKLFNSVSFTYIAKQITAVPKTIQWLKLESGTLISQAEVAANTVARHSHANKPLLDSLDNTGGGDLFLANDGTYKAAGGITAADVDEDELEYSNNQIGLYLATKELATPILNSEWTITDSLGGNSTNSNTTNLWVEKGSIVNLTTAEFKYQESSTKSAPDSIIFGGAAATVPADDTFAPAEAPSAIATLPLTIPQDTNTAYSCSFTKLGSKKMKADLTTGFVYIDSSDENTSNTFRVRHGQTIYAGYSDNVTETDTTGLASLSSPFITGLTSGSSTFNSVQTGVGSPGSYWYLMIPVDFGDISAAVKFSGQPEATLSVNNTVNDAGATEALIRIGDATFNSPSQVSTTYRVYRTRQPNNFASAAQYIKINL